MASLAIFLYPDRVGVSRVKSAGTKPCFSAPIWKTVEDPAQLLTEPVMLASMIREMIGDDKPYDVYLNLWPGAYNAIMFSYGRKNRSDLKRLRQSELETVFRGEYSRLYTYDLSLDKGRASFNEKSRRIIYVIPDNRVTLLSETFRAQKLKICRIAPMDAAAAEAALQFWAPPKEDISICLVLDDACTSIIYLRNNCIQAIRTMTDGFGSVISNYSSISGITTEQCRQLIFEQGLLTENTDASVPLLQDDIIHMLTKLTIEVIRGLHTIFGNEATFGQILLCGNFAQLSGLRNQLNLLLQTECLVADTNTISASAVSSIVLEEKDLTDLFHLSCTTAKGADLMEQYKKGRSDRRSSILLCACFAVAIIALICVTPLQKRALEKEHDAAAALLEQPDYLAVKALFDEKTSLQRQINSLTADIEALPHGQSKTADIIKSVSSVTNDYGIITAIAVDYNAKTIHLNFTTRNYDSFVSWQAKILEEDRFTFMTPPTFEGDGVSYNVEAVMTASDFDSAQEALTNAQNQTEAEELLNNNPEQED